MQYDQVVAKPIFWVSEYHLPNVSSHGGKRSRSSLVPFHKGTNPFCDGSFFNTSSKLYYLLKVPRPNETEVLDPRPKLLEFHMLDLATLYSN
jgi:hypothetical protein